MARRDGRAEQLLGDRRDRGRVHGDHRTRCAQPELERRDLLADQGRRIDARRRVAEHRRRAEHRRARGRDRRVGQAVLERRSSAVVSCLSAASTSAWATFGNSSCVPPVVASGFTTLSACGSSPFGTITIVFGSTLPAMPGLDGRHADSDATREDGQPDEVGLRDGDRRVRPEADAGVGADDAAAGTVLVRRKSRLEKRT